MFNSLNPTSLLGKIFKIPDSAYGKGTVESALGIDVPYVKFAQGGVVPGTAATKGDSELNDRILALLSPGEAVIPRSKMQDPRIADLVKSIMNGTIQVPKFSGGTLGAMAEKAKDAAKEVVDVVDPVTAAIIAGEDPITAMWASVKDKTFAMVMDMFRSNAFHTGGLVPSFAMGGEVPSMLQSGEFVINRSATNSIGTGFLNNLNSGGSSSQAPTFNVTIDIKTTEPIDEVFFRQKVWPKVQNELKRSSLNGDFVMSAKGIRS